MRYEIADESVFELCEPVCGGLRRQPTRSTQRSARTLRDAASGRSGGWAAGRPRTCARSCSRWVVLAIALGALAPRVEHALSGAGWEATGSESVEARETIDRTFGGQGSYALQVVVSSESLTVDDPPFKATVAEVGERHGRRARRRRGHAAAARGVDLARRAHGDRARRRRRSARRDGARGRRPQGQARAHRRRGRPGRPHRRARDVVGLQRGQQVGDAQVRGHLLAGDARRSCCSPSGRSSPPGCR